MAKEICKERGIDPNAKKEPEMAVLDAEANQQEALFLIDDATYLHMRVTAGLWMRSSFWQSGSTLPLPDECAARMM